MSNIDEICGSTIIYTNTNINDNIKQEIRTTNRIHHFVNNVDIWWNQREIDKHHIHKIKEGLNIFPILLEPFTLVYNNVNNKLSLIDGQHRLIALREILEENNEFDKINYIICYIYYVNNEDESCLLFDISNNKKNFDRCEWTLNQEKRMKCYEIVEFIKSEYPNVITKKKTNSPLINKEYLEEILLNNYLLKDINIDNIKNNIIKKNNELKKESFDILLKKRTRGKCISENKRNEIIQQVDKTNCFLFIDKRYSIHYIFDEIFNL
jgi:hypothetical protein